MKTRAEMNEAMKKEFVSYAQSVPTSSKVFPKRFWEIMEKNTGTLSNLCAYGKDEKGMERRNPLVVVLGDSVTAGHFELTDYILKQMQAIPQDKLQEVMQMQNHQGENPSASMSIPPEGSYEVIDVRASYADRFREMLIALYQATSVNVVNAGIAGDTITGMEERLERDVLSFSPDLVIINGSLNWNSKLGTSQTFYAALKRIVCRVKEDSQADIILLTPNMDAGEQISFMTGEPDTLEERVTMILKVAEEENVCLADVYRIWKGFVEKGHSVSEMLANGMNHPTATGHEVYAIELMKLFPKEIKRV